MTTFVFTSPDGKEYEVEGPEGATEEQAFEVLQQQLGAAQTDSPGRDRQVFDSPPKPVQSAVNTLAQFSSGGIEGVLRTLDALENTVLRGPAVVASNLTGVPMPQSATETLRQGIEATGAIVPKAESGPGRIVRRVGEEVGAAMGPAAGLVSAAKAGVQGGALLKPALDAARAAPGKFLAAEAAAAAGAGVGAGVAQEIAPESKGAEIVGLLAGAVAPAAAAGSVRRLVRGGEGTRATMEQSIKEFSEAGVSPTVGMASRRRFNEAVESGLAILPGSSGRMAVYAERTARQLYERVDNITAGLSPLRSTDTAGAAIQSGIKGFVQRFKDRWRTLDAKVAKVVKPEDQVGMSHTQHALTDMSDPVKQAAYPQLAQVVKKLSELSASGSMSYANLRTFRSSVGGLIPDSYATSLPQGELKKLYAAMSTDLRTHLEKASPQALAAFERSNKFYTAAMARLEERLAPLTSSDIPERVFLALERSGHAGRSVVNAAKRSIGKENWDVVTATVFQRMGTASPGAQSTAGDIFSVQTFLTNWNKYAKNKGALEALLSGTSGGSKFVKDMTAIAKVAERFREAGRVFANPSGTARAIANVGAGTSVAMSALAGQGSITLRILAVATGANVSARLFTNPKFVAWLAKSGGVSAERAPALVARLGTELASEPEAVQVEAAAFLDQLSDAFSAISSTTQDSR